MKTMNSVPATTLAVSAIDDKSAEIITAAGGQVHPVKTTVIASLFLVVLPIGTTIATAFYGRRHDIAIEFDHCDHIMLLEAGPDVSGAALRYVACYEIDMAVTLPHVDYGDIDDGPDGPR